MDCNSFFDLLNLGVTELRGKFGDEHFLEFDKLEVAEVLFVARVEVESGNETDLLLETPARCRVRRLREVEARLTQSSRPGTELLLDGSNLPGIHRPLLTVGGGQDLLPGTLHLHINDVVLRNFPLKRGPDSRSQEQLEVIPVLSEDMVLVVWAWDLVTTHTALEVVLVVDMLGEQVESEPETKPSVRLSVK